MVADPVGLASLPHLMAIDGFSLWAEAPASRLLAATAALLLVFVSGGVIYLSAIEWRDRRRRARLEAAGKGRRRP